MASDLPNTLRSSFDLWRMETGTSSGPQNCYYSTFTRDHIGHAGTEWNSQESGSCSSERFRQREGRLAWSQVPASQAAKTEADHTLVAISAVCPDFNRHQRWIGAIPRITQCWLTVIASRTPSSSSSSSPTSSIALRVASSSSHGPLALPISFCDSRTRRE